MNNLAGTYLLSLMGLSILSRITIFLLKFDMLKTLLGIGKKKEKQYMYIMPGVDNTGTWELLNEEELEKRINENRLEEGCRLFVIDQELKVSFERLTHIDSIK